MKITGLHNAANALAALALGRGGGPAELPAMLEAIETFPGLEASLGMGRRYCGRALHR